MERIDEAQALRRAHTDASLDAERVTQEPGDEVSEKRARLADYLIERDRALADEQLRKLRAHSDHALSRRRVNATNDGLVCDEAQDLIVDQERRDERKATDAAIAAERGRTDQYVESGRRQATVGRVLLEIRRAHTDDDLVLERAGDEITAENRSMPAPGLGDAEQLEGGRADVLSMVAHDLRNPLTAIAMNAAIIASTTKEDASREAAEEVSLSAARMERLVSDLLDVAGIDAGAFDMSKYPHDVDTFIAEVHRSYKPLFEARGLNFQFRGIGTHYVVSFDHDRIVQVLSNLLGNALKFNPGGAEVVLAVVASADGVEFAVSDNGPGIAADALPHVFERFWKLESRTRRGLGLGLHICDKIIGAHGGRIWAWSVPGQGATFRFTLPTTRALQS